MSRTEQLLTLETMEEGGEHADAQVAVSAAAAQIAQELRQEREARQCAVCLRSARATVLLPCRHNIMCGSCTEHVERTSRRCPLCRAEVQSSMRVFS